MSLMSVSDGMIVYMLIFQLSRSRCMFIIIIVIVQLVYVCVNMSYPQTLEMVDNEASVCLFVCLSIHARTYRLA